MRSTPKCDIMRADGVGILIMKTKIIYISGSEVFDMADIRAAFDEVRAALALDKSTVLFGVPVDNDDAFATNSAVDSLEKPDMANIVNPISTKETPKESSIVIEDMPVEKPKKTTRHTHAKVVPINPVQEEIADEKPAIPILSVLGAKSESEVETVLPEPESTVETVDVEQIDTTINEQNADTQSVSISDMLADDTEPVEEREKTLEELLESMTPLGEDERVANAQNTALETKVEPDETKHQSIDEDTDATLKLLATEFAESADQIVAPTKPETRGKIGKLKNILPFKKAKRDDSGIMGDLFGWAGVANDEDFTIPGFFANATKK